MEKTRKAVPPLFTGGRNDTMHHLIPTSRFGAVDSEENRIYVADYPHSRFHVLFGTLNPIEQLLWLTGRNADTLSSVFLDTLLDFLKPLLLPNRQNAPLAFNYYALNERPHASIYDRPGTWHPVNPS